MAKLTGLEEKALHFAWHWHGHQVRKYTGEPYQYHLMAVADIVREVMPDNETVLAAAYLHDAVEDTEATLLDIAGHFGKEVADLVEWVTDVSRPSEGNRKRRKEIDRLHLAAAPAEAQTIKLADILDNTKDIVTHDPSFARVYLREKRELVEDLKRGHPVLLDRARAALKETL